jgi:exosortase/archaeosortase family protein
MDLKNLYQKAAYFIKFIGTFCFLYFGTKAVIGLTVPGGYYSAFIARYLDYPALLRSSLLNGTRLLVGIFGFDTYLKDAYRVAVVNGHGVRLIYACLGYGLLSFWIAFIVANNGGWWKKITWLAGGCFVIWFINVIRISLVLISDNEHWNLPISLEQHTLFNIVVYVFIFGMIWLFHRGEKMIE